MIGTAAIATVRAPAPDGVAAGTAPGETDLGRLLRRAGHGDRSSFAAFYDATSPRVYTLALRLGLDVARAELVTEEVFVHAWWHAAGYRPENGDPQTWLLSITRRKVAALVQARRFSQR